MITWIILVVVAIIIFVAWSIAFQEKKRENEALTDKISSLVLKVKDLEHDKESQERVVEFLREIIFFSQLGYKPNNDEKVKMKEQLLDCMTHIATVKTKNSSYRTRRALLVAGHLNETGKELNDIINSLRNLLSESIVGKRSLYPQITDYIYYCGFNFCDKKENPRAEIKEWGELANLSQVDE